MNRNRKEVKFLLSNVYYLRSLQKLQKRCIPLRPDSSLLLITYITFASRSPGITFFCFRLWNTSILPSIYNLKLHSLLLSLWGKSLSHSSPNHLIVQTAFMLAHTSVQMCWANWLTNYWDSSFSFNMVEIFVDFFLFVLFCLLFLFPNQCSL